LLESRNTLNALLIFARAPNPGKVKTRLAKKLGDKKAADFYQLCTDTTLKEISRLPRGIERYVFFDEPVDKCQIERLSGLGFKIEVQDGENLGQRLSNAFKMVLVNGAKKVVIVASDVPDLSTSTMKQALNGLDKNDVVIGPCYDGGYYLIGLKEAHQRLFERISWGTERVCQQTLDTARENGLTILQLRHLIDIDTETDLQRWSRTKGLKKSALLDFIKDLRL
jgi:rSAM/selenodomain-associated transferase 1